MLGHMCPCENISENKQMDHAKLEVLQDLESYFSIACSANNDKLGSVSKQQRDIVQMQKVGAKLMKSSAAELSKRIGQEDAHAVRVWMTKALGDSIKALRKHAEEFKDDIQKGLEEHLSAATAKAQKFCYGGLEEGTKWHQGVSQTAPLSDSLAAGIAAKFTEQACSKKLTSEFKELCQECGGNSESAGTHESSIGS